MSTWIKSNQHIIRIPWIAYNISVGWNGIILQTVHSVEAEAEEVVVDAVIDVAVVLVVEEDVDAVEEEVVVVEVLGEDVDINQCADRELMSIICALLLCKGHVYPICSSCPGIEIWTAIGIIMCIGGALVIQTVMAVQEYRL